MKLLVKVLPIFLLIGNVLNAQNTFPPSGNVGIGTISPTHSLSIVGAAGKISINTQQVLFLPDQTNLVGSLAIGNGLQSLSNTGQYNTSVGMFTLQSNTSGNQNVGVGTFALSQNSSGQSNVSIGHGSLAANTTGNANTAVGNSALYNNINGSNNVAVGISSLVNLKHATNGNLNTAIGYVAGLNLTQGTNNIAIGAQTDLPSAIGSNQLNIGNAIFGIGLTGNVNAPLGNIGIGTSTPGARLEVKSVATNTSGLRFTQLRSTSLSSGAENGKVLSVNSSGDVVLVTSQDILWATTSVGNTTSLITPTGTNAVVIGGSDMNSADATKYNLFVSKGILTEKIKAALPSSTNWSDYVFAKDYKLKSLEEVEAYVATNKHLPGVPSGDELVNEGGIDMNQMFAKQMEKIEELTLYLIEMKKEIKVLQFQNVQLLNSASFTNK